MTTSAPQNAPQDATSPLAPIPDQLPAEWLDEATRDAGLGVSDKAEDLLVPTLTVLQQNSPQCDKRGSKYVPDAEAGDFYLRTSLTPIYAAGKRLYEAVARGTARGEAPVHDNDAA
jgi:hypothetical protein